MYNERSRDQSTLKKKEKKKKELKSMYQNINKGNFTENPNPIFALPVARISLHFDYISSTTSHSGMICLNDYNKV